MFNPDKAYIAIGQGIFVEVLFICAVAIAFAQGGDHPWLGVSMLLLIKWGVAKLEANQETATDKAQFSAWLDTLTTRWGFGLVIDEVAGQTRDERVLTYDMLAGTVYSNGNVDVWKIARELAKDDVDKFRVDSGQAPYGTPMHPWLAGGLGFFGSALFAGGELAVGGFLAKFL